MSTNLEKEYKTLVTKDQFCKLLSLFNIQEEIVQTNYYFDNDDYDVKNSKISCRIRDINHDLECTIKEKINNNTKLEHNFIVSSFNLLENTEICSLLEDNRIKPETLKIMCSLKTTRKIYRDEFGELCFDQNEYNNQVDYEIEYEQTKECDNFFDRFLEILKKADIPYQPSLSKTARCFQSVYPNKDN